MKLHLGCGKRHIPGFVHVDMSTFPHVDHIQDLKNLSNFEDNSADLIYACQVFEYFDREEAPSVLKEWRRVLKVGGVLRLSVPNFEVLCRLYAAGLSLDFMLGTLYGRIEAGDTVIYHRTTYDESSLKKVFIDNGFDQAEKWDWRQTEHAEVDDFSQAYFPHMDKEKGILWNLNMQAKKK